MNEREIVQAALARSSPDERSAFLDDVCSNDTDLRARVDRIIASTTPVQSEAITDSELVTRIWTPKPAQDSELTLDNIDVRYSESLISPRPISMQSTPLPQIEGYDLQEVIGRGGMGIVIKAVDTALQRVVAIKTLAPEFASHPQARLRFSREAQAAAAVRHENIVTIFSVNDSPTLPYLVLEHISGKSLQARIHQQGPLPIAEIVQIAIQIAAGLGAAHRAGVVHRDIKPANILLEDETLRAKITDFGLARVMTDVGLTQTGLVAGTPQFMSPEQAQGLPVDQRSDLFSLGSVMYSMCVAEPAFPAESAVATLRRVCDDQPASLRTCRSDVPDWLCDAIEKLMAKRPPDRFQSAAELEQLLRTRLDMGECGGWSAAVSHLRLSGIQHPAAQKAKRPLTKVAGAFVALAIAFILWRTQVAPVAQPDPKPVPVHTAQLVTEPTVTPLDPPEPPVNPLLSNDFEWSDPVNLGENVNSPAHDDHACISADGRTLLFMRSSDGMRRLWQCRRTKPEEPFGLAEVLPENINSSKLSEAPFLTSDGLSLWYVSSRPGGVGENDIWLSRRTSVDAPFEDPVNVGPPVNSETNEASPFLSAEGLTLLFGRGVPRQILRATRSKPDEPFGEPQPLPNLIFGVWSEFPRMTSDGRALIYVLSERQSHQELYLATRKDTSVEFDPPVNLGPEVNSGTMSGPALSPDGYTLYFSSNRPGGSGKFDLWMTRRVPRTKPVNNRPKETSHSTVATDEKLTPSERLASANYEWQRVEELGEPVSTPAYEAGPAITSDGLTLLFHGQADRVNRTGNLKIWQARRRAVSDPFLDVLLLDNVINDQPDSLSDPTLTSDGRTLAFCMSRSDGSGSFDIWTVDRPGVDALWNAPVNAGGGVNSEFSEWEPELSADGLTLLFHSDRPNPNGGTDLWMSRRESRQLPFGPAENLGSEINSANHEGGAALSSDGLTLLFHRVPASADDKLSHCKCTRASRDQPFGRLEPLLIPGLVEANGTGLCLTYSADMIYCTTAKPGEAPNISRARRVKRQVTPP